MAWIWLFIAGCFEILGVVLLNELNRTNNKLYIVLIAIAFVFSFSTLKIAMNTIPMGTAYAIWTGIGTAGGTLIGMLIYQESKKLSRILCLLLIIISVIGLKLIS
ncbi:multidrug efflux SMR transporter [Staphylococcus simiae]|uniref:DMT family transporter n=1 Tax=Staphylococcus simiae TaxID=308354 RepID=UPI001A95A7DC|nr:multidrug efflux SMR transporter [Staphylococcus simiae]MBO1199831.1 multidrug efflux SMR transporter [Staphylococcus simiae]MBO1201952.1 multidrug efflux SMR transporter [Staphylococcus simiae]MBO1204169.1 multidrug efflux SMR transporter [Staphylococcus simiae]MBO1211896.1 multidrug efflux SMR transporter [Staphylococcus simiae]MBO1230401.1 multidrug efflux SMR transporter [Staphylococcus simiae]